MSRTAVIINNVVENIIISDLGFSLGRDELLVPLGDLWADIGDLYIDGVFLPRPSNEEV